jgi:hypothetical protein
VSIGTKYDVSRAGSVSMLIYRKQELLFLRMEVEPSSKTLCSVRNAKRWAKFGNKAILIVIYHCQNPSELIFKVNLHFSHGL